MLTQLSKNCRICVARIHYRWSFFPYLFRKSIHQVFQVLNLHCYNLWATSCRLYSQSCQSKRYALHSRFVNCKDRGRSLSLIAGHIFYIVNLRSGKVWAEVEAGPSNLLSYTNNILWIVIIYSTFEYDYRYIANLNILYKIIIAYYITIS